MEDLSQRKVMAFCVLLFFLITLAYGNTLHAPLNFDDSMVIKTQIAQDGEQYFQPHPPKYRHLFYLSFAINYAQGKLDPLGYHLVNISLHFFTTLIVFFISYITIKRGTNWGAHSASAIAIITTLFFAVSPVHTETVTYISGRATGLAGLFYFSTLLMFLLANFSERGVTSRFFFCLLAVVFFVAAVLSKETSLTLPALILLYDFCFMKGDSWSPRKPRFLFFYLPLGVLGVLTLFKILFMKAMILEWAQKIDFDYALQQTRIIGHGIYLLFFPIGLTLDYDFPDAFFPHPALRAWPILLIAALLIGVVKYYPKFFKMALFGSLWFLLTIAPTNSILPRLDSLSERNLYIPSFGIILLITSFSYSFFISQGTRFRRIGISFLAAILIFHTALLVDRNATYRSNTSIWEDTVKKAPGKSRAWQNLSHYYLMELNYLKALESLQGLIRSNPSDKYLSQAQSKLGIIHSRQGHFFKAISAYNESIRLDPKVASNHLNLGGAYLRQGKYSEAKKTYENAERLFKSNSSLGTVPPKLYLNKAFILFRLRLYEKAETAALTYLSRDPESNYAHSLLGNIYMASGKKVEAELEFAKATKFTDSK